MQDLHEVYISLYSQRPTFEAIKLLANFFNVSTHKEKSENIPPSLRITLRLNYVHKKFNTELLKRD